jgi:hypothetical protein
MRRFIPFLILGVLTVGAVVGLIVGLAGSHPKTVATGSALSSSSGTSPSVTPGTSPVVPTSTTSTSPGVVTNQDTIKTCSLVTAAEVKALLNQIVNNPPVVKAPFCSYEGIVTVPPSTKPPTLSVTAVTDPKTLASAEAEISNNVAAICGKSPTASCLSVLQDNNHVTIDGSPVIWRQSITTVDGDVGSAYTAKNGTVVAVTVSGLPNAEQVAREAMADVLPRL